MSLSLEQFNSIRNNSASFSVSDFKNKEDRTLLYGYTCARDTFHLYMKDEKICVYIYEYNKSTVFFEESEKFTDLSLLVPDKRVYPESSDIEAVELLLKIGVNIPFTVYDKERYLRVKDLVFHGEIKED